MRIEALVAARLSGIFAHSDQIGVVGPRRTAHAAHEKLTHEAVLLGANAARKKQLIRRVERNVKIGHLEADGRLL